MRWKLKWKKISYNTSLGRVSYSHTWRLCFYIYIYIFIYWILIGAKSAPFKKVGNMWFPTLTLIPIPWLKAHGNNLSKPLLNSVHCFLVFWFSLSSLYFLVFLLLGFLFCCVFLSFLTSSVLPFIACWHWKRKFLTVTTKRY